MAHSLPPPSLPPPNFHTHIYIFYKLNSQIPPLPSPLRPPPSTVLFHGSPPHEESVDDSGSPPSPIPTGTGSRSAANETFKEFLETKSIQLPHLSLPESRFVSAANPLPALVDFRLLLASPDGDAVARMLRSATDFGAFRIVNHGISGEEVLSVVKEAKSVLDDSSSERNGGAVDHEAGNRTAIVQVCHRRHGGASENSVARDRHIRGKMEEVARKVEGIGEKLSEILSESMGEEWGGDDQKVKKKRSGEKESTFSIFRYNNHKNQFHEERENEERESDESVMMSLHIPTEHCQFFVNPHPHGSFCFDAAAGTIVVTIGKQLQEWSMGRFKSARSEMIFVPNLLGSQASISIEHKISHPKLLNHPHSNIISISDQIFIALLLLSLYLLYTYISSLFKAK